MSQTSILQTTAEAGEPRQKDVHAQEGVSMVVSPVTGESSPASKIPSADSIVEELVKHCPDADVAMVRRAYDYASAAHAGQLRLSGDPYILHPASVALTLAKMGFDEHTVAAGLLHDTVEDTDSSIDELDELFGEQVADIVDGVTKINMMTFDTKEEAQAENIRKMILSMAHDIRVPGVKLGLANLASIVSLYLLGAGAAAAIALVRIVLVGFTFGNLSMMLYSLAGAAVSLLLMVVFRRLDWFGVTGVSILGGAGHNIGQLIVAALVVENASLFYYLPVLLAAGTAAGALIGLLGGILVNRLKCLDLTKFM